MTRPVLAALLLLWSAGPVFAQEGEPAPAPTQQGAEAAYQELARALTKAISDWRTEAMKAVKEAQAEGRAIPAIAMTPPTKEFIVRAQELAEQYSGTDDAIQFHAFVVKNASNESDAVRQSLKALWADHSSSKAIGPVLGFVARAYFGHDAQKEVDSLLEAVITDNPEVDVQAQALLERGNLRLQVAATDAQRKLAADDIRKVATMTKNAEILEQAKGALFEIDHLQVGCTAPEIVAKDTDGVEFKLSDYKGKVVLLDFWGFW